VICGSLGFTLSSCFHRVTSGRRIALDITERSNGATWTFTVTCRIHRQAIGDGRVLVRVSGWITGDNVSTLRTLLGEEKSSALILDLKDVRSVDSEAIKLLVIHESKGARIDNCPLYIRERIRRERDAT
jgi:hypothetical protein